MEKGPVLVSGTINILAAVGHFEGAVTHVYVEEISRQDSAARLIAETQIENVKHQPQNGQRATTVVPFEMVIPAETNINPNKTYALQVWIDVIPDGKGRGAEDLYSDRSYPVLTGDDKQFAEVIIGG